MSDDARYQRQVLLPGIGSTGQAKLAAARVLLVGCGALGTVLADQLVRAGVGFLRIVDRDLVEISNLQRQVLFDDADAREQIPKAIAATQRLAEINPSVRVEGIVADLHAGNAQQLIGLGEQAVHLLLDGTDNSGTRYLLNDAAVRAGVPWIYGACVGTEGRMMTIQPGVTACLRCVFPSPPGPGELPTCDTAGVLAGAAGCVASLQAAAAIRLLVGHCSEQASLISVDAWTGRFQSVQVGGPDPACHCCGMRRFEFLDVPLERSTVELCGRNAVQIRPAADTTINLTELSQRLSAVGRVQPNRFLLRFHPAAEPAIALTIFPDGRTLVQGTSDLARARSLVSRFVGS